MDISLMRMQYEILNAPVSCLAEASGISEELIQEEIERADWKQYWPDEPSLANPEALHTYLAKGTLPPSLLQALPSVDPTPSSELGALTPGPIVPKTDEPEVDDHFMTTTAELIERSRRRLQVYTLAKETLMSTQYLELEKAIVDQAIVLALEINTSKVLNPTGALKDLAAIFKSVTSGTSLTSAGNIQIGDDGSGLPMLIYKDLSGRK